MIRWAILTGEYPPQPGGVSDYTHLIAKGLAEAGDEVAVFAPTYHDTGPDDPGVTLRRLPDHFGPRGLLDLDNRLRTGLPPDRILIQYVPQAYGWKAMNLPFTTWVAHRARHIAPVWVMFHEVMSGAGRPLRHAVLSTVTRQMARQLARCADRIFVSIPAWGEILRRTALSGTSAEWLPIPSIFPASCHWDAREAVRINIPATAATIGHFGTYGHSNVGLLAPSFAPLIRQSANRFALFIGRGSLGFRDRLLAAYPDLADRVSATGDLESSEASAHLAACDLLIQPYIDGASSRRTSLMAGLALGVPTITNLGFLSETFWGTDSPGVTVVPSPDPFALAAAAESLLRLGPEERTARGRLAAAWYRSQFAPEHTISRLRTVPPPLATHSDWP